MKKAIVLVSAVLCVAAAVAGPFDLGLDLVHPVRVAYPASSGSGASVFDVVASTVSANSFYVTTMLGTPALFGVAEYTLDRGLDGNILPLVNPTDPTENRRWQINLFDANGTYNKALDVLSEDAGSVRLLTVTEQGDAALTDTHGTIELITITNRDTGAGSASVWKDLTSERADGNLTYHPEGIAIDRANQRVLVVTDDGETTGRQQGGRIYTYDGGTFAENGTAWNYGLTAAGAAGSDDGRQAIALADGSFLLRVGTGTERGIWKVDAAGNATELMNEVQIAFSVQDMAVRSPDGSNYYLYLLDGTNFRITAYEWNNLTQTLVDTTPDGALSFASTVVSQFGWGSGNYPAGLSFTLNNEILISFAQSGSPGGVIAYTIPEPASLALLGLAFAGLLRRPRRAA